VTPVARPLSYPLCLLTGALLIIVAAALHPDLAGDGAAQLAIIARCDAWRAIHWAFLFGIALSLTGLVGVVASHAGTAGEGSARGGVVVAVLAYSAWMVIVAFMAVFLYDMTHPFALAAQRLAAFALGISTYLFGWGVVQARALPRWLGWAGVASGLVAVALALGFGEATKADEAAFALPVLWQFVVALVQLAGRRGAAA